MVTENIMNDHETEIRSLQALSDFWKNDRDKTTTPHGSVYFVTPVEYLLRGRPPFRFESVTILIETTGYRPHIQLLDVVPSENYHTTFSPRFEVMSLDGNVLVIKGSSQKMGGDYVVRVLCTERTHPKE